MLNLQRTNVDHRVIKNHNEIKQVKQCSDVAEKQESWLDPQLKLYSGNHAG